MCNLGSCNILEAELQAFLHGIRVAKSLDLRKVMFETDSLLIVQMVASGSTSYLQLKSLLEEIISLFHSPDWQVSLQHVFRGSNKCDDFLAKSGLMPLVVCS